MNISLHHHRPLAPLPALLLSLLFIPVAAQATRNTPDTALPKVVLIGDSIRLGYAPLVARRLAGRAIVITHAANGGDSNNVLRNIDEWVIREKPDIVHFNCGLHDLKLGKAGKQHQVPLPRYADNLREIIARIRRETTAQLVFALTTPIMDDRHAARGADFDRLEADVLRYNQTALRVMRETGLTAHDLHWVVEQAGAAQIMVRDGTHYTTAGYERLAEAVADCLLRQISVLRYKPFPPQPAGPEAAAAYDQAVSARDAMVPGNFRIRAPEFAIPATAAAWRKRRPEVLRVVRASLGDLPPRPRIQTVRRVTREIRAGYALEKIAIDNGVDSEISALLLIPDQLTGRAPAVLWLHSSTPDKTQIITPDTNGGPEPLGEALVRRGYVVMSPDAYWHGDRVGTGPSGALETGVNEQTSLFKWHLWMGRTLWGMFVRDDQIALDYLAARPEVNAARIGATGMSMGSTRAWWLAALDDRVAATVGVACLTRYENLIHHGELRAHGVYYFVNGLLRHFDTEGVLSLLVPRPYLALTGDLDAGSPVDGIRQIEAKLGTLYEKNGAAGKFKSIVYPQTGHSFTPQMRAETLAWFDRWLK